MSEATGRASRPDAPVAFGAAPPAARACAAAIYLLLAIQLAVAAVRDSVTIDEFVGLPVGLYALQHHDVRSTAMNPVFARAAAALPLLFGSIVAPSFPPMNEENDWRAGYRFMADHPSIYHALFIPARCVVAAAAIALAALVQHWATALYGWPSGLVALFLFACSPTVLAQAHLVTLDLWGAVAWTLAAYATWRLLERPTATRALAVGIAVAIAPLLKLSGVMVPLAVGALLAMRIGSGRDVPRARWLGLAALAYAVALLVVNACYAFDGTASPIGGVELQAPLLKTLAVDAPWLRLPIPEPLLRSLDTLLVGDQPTEPAYFLAGRWSLGGWWYYHLIALALKTPIPFLLASAFACGAWLAGRRNGRDEACVLLPVFVVFAANSLMNPLNIGVRHALPVYPLLAISIAPWLAAPLVHRFGGDRSARTGALAIACGAALVWQLVATLSIAPRYLEYFNELAGGPREGHRWLVDSNLDWGQDLVRLSEFMKRRGLESVPLAYFGRVDPRVYGIAFTPIEEGRTHGLAVVSASLLMGRPYWLWRSPGELVWSHHDAFRWLRAVPVRERVGSLFVLEIP